MKQQKQESEYGEIGKRNHRVEVLFTKQQKERLQFLAESSGFKTISSMIRHQCLNPSLELKINEILKLLRSKEEVVENE